MRLDRVLVLGLVLAASLARAQLVPPDPDWREAEAPPPPAFSADGLIPLDMPGSALRFGVAPASVAVGSDGVVRYVLVASSAGGAVNGLYQGIRCSTGEYKVYARHNPGSGWVVAKDSPWVPLQEGSLSRATLAVARSGACIGRGTNQPAAKILRDLRSPASRFDQP